MTEYKMEDPKKNKMKSTLGWLETASKLIAFINTYGPLYDDYYFSLILNLNNITENYLLNGDPKVIGKVYLVYQHCRYYKKSEKETYDELRSILYQLPVYSISAVKQRSARRNFL